MGLPYHDSLPGMALAPITRGSRDAPLTIERVDASRWGDFVAVTMASYGYAPEQGPQLLPQRFVDAPGTQWFVGYADGEPVAGSMLYVLGATAGVNFIGTLEGHRGKGYGEAVTWQVVNAGVDAGCRHAILQASEMGFGVYERMGFRTITHYKSFVRPQFLGS
jgi:GNAT superfamily N-acetyltransferase